ncbi:MAG: NAD(P)H-hydrate epimerase, partial [Rhodoferax sp.]
MYLTHRVDPLCYYPLHSVQATRTLEQAALASLPPHTLMQRAGLAVAQWACALAPHARNIWLACGPGNNGGDGLEAAFHLQQRGCKPIVTWLGQSAQVPPDAQAAWQRARQAGVVFADTPPEQPDLCIDALLGIGSTRAPVDRMAQWIEQMNAGTAPVLA